MQQTALWLLLLLQLPCPKPGPHQVALGLICARNDCAVASTARMGDKGPCCCCCCCLCSPCCAMASP
jgi:hypothetical protein